MQGRFEEEARVTEAAADGSSGGGGGGGGGGAGGGSVGADGGSGGFDSSPSPEFEIATTIENFRSHREIVALSWSINMAPVTENADRTVTNSLSGFTFNDGRRCKAAIMFVGCEGERKFEVARAGAVSGAPYNPAEAQRVVQVRRDRRSRRLPRFGHSVTRAFAPAAVSSGSRPFVPSL